MFPPEAPRATVPAMLLPVSTNKTLTVSDVVRSSLLKEAKQLLNDNEPRILALPVLLFSVLDFSLTSD